MNLNKIKIAANKIKNSKNLIITAGAGMGHDSGLPDYRGPEGLWKAYHPLKKLRMNFQDAANPEFFIDNPNLAWGFYGHRYNLYKKVTPHLGFNILLDWVKTKNNYFVITSNVDDHFYKSGFDKENILEIHGCINYFQCNICNYIKKYYKDQIKVYNDTLKVKNEDLPKCDKCQSLLRPNILMFNDWDFNSERVNWQNDNYSKFKSSLVGFKEDKSYKMNKKIDENEVVIIELGAGLAIPSIRIISENYIKNTNYFLIRINTNDSQCNIGEENINYISLEYKSIEALQIIKNELNKI